MQTSYCDIELDKAKRDAFVYAINNHYWYQMYIDDLPIWGKYLDSIGCLLFIFIVAWSNLLTGFLYACICESLERIACMH